MKLSGQLHALATYALVSLEQEEGWAPEPVSTLLQDRYISYPWRESNPGSISYDSSRYTKKKKKKHNF